MSSVTPNISPWHGLAIYCFFCVCGGGNMYCYHFDVITIFTVTLTLFCFPNITLSLSRLHHNHHSTFFSLLSVFSLHIIVVDCNSFSLVTLVSVRHASCFYPLNSLHFQSSSYTSISYPLLFLPLLLMCSPFLSLLSVPYFFPHSVIHHSPKKCLSFFIIISYHSFSSSFRLVYSFLILLFL